MSFLGKKGDMKYGVLIGLIVVLVAFVGIAIFTGRFSIFLGGASEDEICRTSILTASQSKSFLNIGKPITPLKCPRKEVVIKKSDIVENGKINQDKAHKIIAEEMFKCWNKVGAGKLDPFTNWKDSAWESGEESLCLICSTVTFDNNLIGFMKGGGPERAIHSPVNYLKKTKIPTRGETYWEFFYNERGPLIDEAELEDAGVLPNSLILVNMYKKTGKSFLGEYIIGGVVIAGGILLAIPTGGVSFIAALGTAWTFFQLGAAVTIVSAGLNTFSDCSDCNGAGGLMLVPDGIELNTKRVTELDGGEKKEIPLCTKIVN
ncbi:MAG: DoxX family protein [Nanoarchaeota archaeon]